MSGKYDDILHLPHPTSKKHPRMSIRDRAAIAETARLTEQRVDLDEDTKAELDRRQAVLLEHIEEQPEVTVTWFQPDEWKDGGAYVTVTGRLKKIDEVERTMTLLDGTVIPLDDVVRLESDAFAEPDGRLGEIALALRELKAGTIQECELLEARCSLPGITILQDEYDDLNDLIRDGNDLGLLLEEQGQGMPDFMDMFALPNGKEVPAMAEDTKNLCAQIPAALHTRVRQEQEAAGKTLSEYMTWLITEFYENGGKQTMNVDTKTVAFQVPVELFEEFKAYLRRSKQTQKDFFLSCIQRALEKEPAATETE